VIAIEDPHPFALAARTAAAIIACAPAEVNMIFSAVCSVVGLGPCAGCPSAICGQASVMAKQKNANLFIAAISLFGRQ
jgi:hypothetical protein